MNRIKRMPERDHHFTTWFILSFGIATTISAIIVAVANPVGTTLLSHLINMAKMIAINGLLFPIWTIIVGILFSFIYLPVPRLFLASFSYTFVSTVVILTVAKSGTLFSFMIGIIYSLIALLVGFLLIILFHKNIKRNTKIAVFATLLISTSSYLLFNQLDMKKTEIPAIAEHMEPILDENPANKGAYNYKFFTYGSGDDIHRAEYGPAVDQITPTVDASDFITTWSKDREDFWGFDPSELPVNGRVWLPDDAGTFPIILMVHGNHTMEYLSTSGYDYLGELLASRGFIAISVDQDFINYSNTYGSPNDNYELRTWMLLQHLVQLQNMNETPESNFYQKVDFQQVGLVGHSRGGQAVLMADDHQTFFNDDELLESMESIDIKGIVSIAPTDKRINGDKPSIHNTSYLLLHGARDADVSSFRDQPFQRTTFDADYDGFKASVYIADANHTHFNSEWGSMDLSFPRGAFLNQQQTLDPEDQQQLAKVYLSAFFESVFHGHSSYEKLFQDHRYGKNWLPETALVNNYQHASYRPILTFDKNDVEVIDVTGFTKSNITTPKDRNASHRLQDALRLEWEDDALYTIDLSEYDLSGIEHLVFTMANVDDDAENESVPEILIELETNDDVLVSLPLDEFMPFPSVISTDFTHFGLFDDAFRDEKYINSWEPVFQTFEVSIDTLEQTNAEFKKENIDKATLHFKSQPGKILIEEIGLW